MTHGIYSKYKLVTNNDIDSKLINIKSFKFEEKLGKIYTLKIIFSIINSHYLNEKQFVKSRVQFQVFDKNENNCIPIKIINGIISSLCLLNESDDIIEYSCTVVPFLYDLSLSKTYRNFQHSNVVDIISSLLNKRKFKLNKDFKFVLSKDYKKIQYQAQINESDYSLINRLCEKFGIWYYFHQSNEQEVLVFCDSSSLIDFNGTRSVIKYTPSPENVFTDKNDVTDNNKYRELNILKNYISSYSIKYDNNYSNTIIRDSNYESTEALHVTNIDSTNNEIEYQWGNGVKNVDEANDELRIIDNIKKSKSCIAKFNGLVLDKSIGENFSFVKKFSDEKNNRSWFIYENSLVGTEESELTSSVTCIPSNIDFNLERMTVVPKIVGSIPGRIVSAGNSKYAYIDEYGRYIVRLPYDFDQWTPGGDSLPMRLAKPFAGDNFGFHFPLLAGTEVMISFVNGDPNRPYISGVMNGLYDPVTNRNNHKNKVISSKGNLLEFDDLENKQHITLSTPGANTGIKLGNYEKDTEGFNVFSNKFGLIQSSECLMFSSSKSVKYDCWKATVEQPLFLMRENYSKFLTKNNIAVTCKFSDMNIDNMSEQLVQSYTNYTVPSFLAYSEAMLSLVSNKTMFLSSNLDFYLGTDQNLVMNSNNKACLQSKSDINVFSESGNMAIGTKEGNIRLSSGDAFSIQSKKAIEIKSNEDSLTIAAPNEILITSGKAYIKLKDGDIEIGCPGNLNVFSSNVQFNEPKQLDYKYDDILIYKAKVRVIDEVTKRPIPNFVYSFTTEDGTKLVGRTDINGDTMVINTGMKPGKAHFSVNDIDD